MQYRKTIHTHTCMRTMYKLGYFSLQHFADLLCPQAEITAMIFHCQKPLLGFAPILFSSFGIYINVDKNSQKKDCNSDNLGTLSSLNWFCKSFHTYKDVPLLNQLYSSGIEEKYDFVHVTTGKENPQSNERILFRLQIQKN